MSLAQFGNQYFNNNEPWKLVKEDKKRCATVLHVCFKIIKALAVFTYPYLPFSSEKIWNMIGNKKTIQEENWEIAFEELKIGVKLEKPQLLFKKLLLQDFMEAKDPFS